jgi:hypothetical protein
MDDNIIRAKIFKGIADTAERTKQRRKIIRGSNLAPRFEGIDNSDCHELLATLKQLRWRLHHATTSYNLSVSQRRRHSTTDKYMSFAGQNTQHLTLSRICLQKYCRGKKIETNAVIEEAVDYNLSRTAVYDFFTAAVAESVFVKTDKGEYEYTEEALDHQFDNMLSLLCDQNTWRLYRNLELAYGVLHAAAVSSRTGFREVEKTRMSQLIELQEQLKNDDDSPESGLT